jgi:hypothetical protein
MYAQTELQSKKSLIVTKNKEEKDKNSHNTNSFLLNNS